MLKYAEKKESEKQEKRAYFSYQHFLLKEGPNFEG